MCWSSAVALAVVAAMAAAVALAVCWCKQMTTLQRELKQSLLALVALLRTQLFRVPMALQAALVLTME